MTGALFYGDGLIYGFFNGVISTDADDIILITK